jgi:hypothetical protein
VTDAEQSLPPHREGAATVQSDWLEVEYTKQRRHEVTLTILTLLHAFIKKSKGDALRLFILFTVITDQPNQEFL